jgi:ethanolamine ammonia-lyase small subunit
MAVDRDGALGAAELSAIVRKIRARTPARLLVGRAGGAYRTNTELDLLDAQAVARDAVRTEMIPEIFPAGFIEQSNLFEVSTKARSKDEYLMRPDLGRTFDDEARIQIRRRCSCANDIQIAIGDGLSVLAVATQVPVLLPLLQEEAKKRDWKIGETFAIRHCRVGILNEIGELLRPCVALLLIGERPGLTTAESLSAYMAYKPNPSHTDANRNLVSNIHSRGLRAPEAAARILSFAEQMTKSGTSGFALKGEIPKLGD